MKSKAHVVMVVDDEPTVRTATRRLLVSAGYEVQTFSRTAELFAEDRPDTNCCVIVDLCIPGESGLQFQQRLLDDGIRVPIIFISGRGDIISSVKAMKSGAIDFLPKPYQDQQLIDAVDRALLADDRERSRQRSLGEYRDCYGDLTEREREVFAAVAAGLLNKQIAMQLGVAERTIKAHRARVMEKMHAVALADLVRIADLLKLHWDSPENTAAYMHLSAVGVGS